MIYQGEREVEISDLENTKEAPSMVGPIVGCVYMAPGGFVPQAKGSSEVDIHFCSMETHWLNFYVCTSLLFSINVTIDDKLLYLEDKCHCDVWAKRVEWAIHVGLPAQTNLPNVICWRRGG